MDNFWPYILRFISAVWILSLIVSAPPRTYWGQNLLRIVLWLFVLGDVYFTGTATFFFIEARDLSFALRSEATRTLLERGIFLVLTLTAAIVVERKVFRARQRLCPWCAEYIRPEAVTCRYCHQDVT